jgi:hypothetical protein
MKRLAAIATCLTALACASGDTQNVKLTQPDLELVQLSGPADQGFPPGLFQVEYGMRIRNNSGEPITLQRIDLEPMGGGGPYRLRRESYNFNATIPPGQTRELTFRANAFSTGTWSSIDANAPVSIRGVATFESPAGKIRKIFVKVLGQERSRRD